MNLTRDEKQQKINSIMRYIALYIFNHNKGKPNYTRAYEKLHARVMLDWDEDIINAIKESKDKTNNMFTMLSDDELDKVHKSSLHLMDMYKKVIEKKCG
ncbi:hypothetical protein ACR77J_07600 [Tissierella praeacuta]|uniref:hypothetical protein n=1 Tax=Tissierella praeacuta TaxID=43131 RepID=UPI003DA6C9A9